MKKIVIIGSPGAGKSTFAQALGEMLHIEIFHLDRYFWQPGWKEFPRKTRIDIQQQLLKGKERWIIEGTYLGSSTSRLNAADTIIFLDIPRFLCLWRAVKRHITYRGYSRPDIPDGCTDRLSPLYILKILVFPHKGRNLLLAKIKEILTLETNKWEKKTIYTIRSNEELKEFLRSLPVRQLEEHVYEDQKHVLEPASEQAVALALNKRDSLNCSVYPTTFNSLFVQRKQGTRVTGSVSIIKNMRKVRLIEFDRTLDHGESTPTIGRKLSEPVVSAF